jgi:predicted RNA binding protein YcfA (HicA-like mRNA interferase family)
MEYFGFILVRTRGSHHLYQHPKIEDVMNVQPQKDMTAKSYQVQQFLKLIDIHQLRLIEEPEE